MVEEEKTVDRRGFLTGAAVVAAGAVTASIAGCTTPTGSNNEAQNTAGWYKFLPEKWDDEADIIIVGYGGSGSMASVWALKAGASVIVLEKAPARLGGNLGQSRGALHDCPDADVEEWADCYVRGSFKCGASREEIKKFMQEAVEIPRWLDELGIDCVWTPTPHPTGKTWPKYFTEGYVNKGLYMGADLFGEINRVATSLDVDVRVSMRAKRLIQNPGTKEILGVVAESEGRDYYYKAKKGVIMACGSYGRNSEMFYNYNYPGIEPVGGNGGNPNNDGDGFPMVIEVGAKLWHMNNWHSSPFSFTKPWREEGIAHGVEGGGGAPGPNLSPEPGIPRGPQGHFIVGWHGKRFLNETYGRAHDSNQKPALAYSTQVAFSKIITWTEDPAVAQYADITSDYVHLPMYRVFDQKYYDASNPMMTDTKDNDEAVAKGWIFKGNTIEELAAKIEGARPSGEMVKGMDPVALRETFERWNEICEEGEDTDFLRPSNTLTSLNETGPYYAAEVMYGMDFCEGGPERNGSSQTISVRDEIIPRLYNTGEFGSYNSLAYVVGGIVQALTTGKIAAQHAASLDPWDQ